MNDNNAITKQRIPIEIHPTDSVGVSSPNERDGSFSASSSVKFRPGSDNVNLHELYESIHCLSPQEKSVNSSRKS